MAKAAAQLREKADRILAEAKEEAKRLRKKADELEAQEDLALLKNLRASGKLDELKSQMKKSGHSESEAGVNPGDENEG